MAYLVLSRSVCNMESIYGTPGTSKRVCVTTPAASWAPVYTFRFVSGTYLCRHTYHIKAGAEQKQDHTHSKILEGTQCDTCRFFFYAGGGGRRGPGLGEKNVSVCGTPAKR